LAKLMLFGDLKNGGILTIGVDNDNIALLVKPKVPRLEYNEQDQSSSQS